MKKTFLLMLLSVLPGVKVESSNFQSLKNVAEVGLIVELGFIAAKWAVKHDLIKLPGFNQPVADQENQKM